MPRLEDAVEHAAHILGAALDAMCALLIRTGGAPAEMVALGLFHPEPEIAAELERSHGIPFHGRPTLAGAVLENGETIFRNDLTPADLTRVGARYASVTERWGLTTLLFVALSGRTGRVGVTTLSRLGGKTPFSDAEVACAHAASALIGLIVEDALLIDAMKAGSPAQEVSVEWRPAAKPGGHSEQLLQASETLSAREQEILVLLGRGFTNREVAEQLYLSVRTVEWHRSRIQWKLGISNRAELIEASRAIAAP